MLNRYLFDEMHVRGELVQLEQTFEDITSGHQYPDGVKALIGELIAATCLLTATLKFEGEIAIQLQGNGPVGYIAVNGNHQQEMRAVAKIQTDTNEVDLQALMGKANMVITIRPKNGEAYQGVVALDKPTLAECFAHYFEVSEQIPTQLWLFNDLKHSKVAGCLVQLLPDGEDKAKQAADFEHLCQITNTIKAEEILTLDAQTLLYRLYHQEALRLFEPQSVTFKCSCSEDKCITAISQIEPSELRAIIAEEGAVAMTCDYCNTTYEFNEAKLSPWLEGKPH